MVSNKCSECKFGSIRIEILVPDNCSIENFAEETRDFPTEIISMTKRKPMQYALTFGSVNRFSNFEFKIHYCCSLNIGNKRLPGKGCVDFRSGEGESRRVKHLTYSKKGHPKKIELKMGELI